jgi:predicted CoA-substrate-specific enzyme activase
VIALDEGGMVSDFIMNDKCAAGTGRFLQVMAGVLDETLDGLGSLAAGAEPVSLSSMCAVFAESEIIGLLAKGLEKERIAAGILDTIARRVQGLAGRIALRDTVTFTGGTANNPAICRVIAAHLGVKLHVPEDPQFVGALGAALIAAD